MMTDKERAQRTQAAQPITVARWPIERWPEGVGLSVKDGWNFGLGFGLAMTIALPFILGAAACLVSVGLAIVGGSLGALVQ